MSRHAKKVEICSVIQNTTTPQPSLKLTRELAKENLYKKRKWYQFINATQMVKANQCLFTVLKLLKSTPSKNDKLTCDLERKAEGNVSSICNPGGVLMEGRSASSLLLFQAGTGVIERSSDRALVKNSQNVVRALMGRWVTVILICLQLPTVNYSCLQYRKIYWDCISL